MNFSSQIRSKSTLEKALDINLEPLFYGTFAEIGAGQEVARQFFQAGKASQTVALTISAYDMTYSDIIYGKEKSGRYVCESRLRKMLEREYEKLLQRLSSTRGKESCFFAFANTVATSSGSSSNNSHGWMGLRFQHKPGAEYSEIILHLRLLDRHRLQQQEVLSTMGVNLIHAAFYKNKHPDDFINALYENVKLGSLAADALHISGEAFNSFNEIKINLEMVDKGFSEALFINKEGQVKNIQDALWGKSILIQRSSFSPVTNTHIDVSEKGVKHFSKEFDLKNSEIESIFEFTLVNRFKNSKVKIEDALKKIDMLSSLKKPILVSNFTLFYQLKAFVRLMTDKPMGVVLGALHLEKLFDENFYSDLAGGLLEAMGKLVDLKTRLYIYPHKTELLCLQVKSFRPKPQMKHVYSHLVENHFIQDIADCDNITKMIHADDILKLIKKNDSQWKKLVPEPVHKFIDVKTIRK